MSEYIERKEYEEHAKRMEDEHDRLHKRLEIVEEDTKNLSKLCISVESLANSVKTMLKEQEKHDQRIVVLESRDGEKWRDTMRDIAKILLGAAIGFLLTEIGIS